MLFIHKLPMYTCYTIYCFVSHKLPMYTCYTIYCFVSHKLPMYTCYTIYCFVSHINLLIQKEPLWSCSYLVRFTTTCATSAYHQ